MFTKKKSLICWRCGLLQCNVVETPIFAMDSNESSYKGQQRKCSECDAPRCLIYENAYELSLNKARRKNYNMLAKISITDELQILKQEIFSIHNSINELTLLIKHLPPVCGTEYVKAQDNFNSNI